MVQILIELALEMAALVNFRSFLSTPPCSPFVSFHICFLWGPSVYVIMKGPTWNGAIRGDFNQRQAPVLTERPHTDKHALCRRAETSKNALKRSELTHVYTQTQVPSADMVSGCRAQQDWNAAYCFRGHLTTIADRRQLAPQCLHAGLCRSLSASLCCGALQCSFHCLGNRSLVQLIN